MTEFDSKFTAAGTVPAPGTTQDKTVELKPAAPLSALNTNTGVNLLSACADNAKSLGLKEGCNLLIGPRFTGVNPELLNQVLGVLENAPEKRLERITEKFDPATLVADGGKSFFTNPDVGVLANLHGAATAKLKKLIAQANQHGDLTSAYEKFKLSSNEKSIRNLDGLL